MNWLFIYPSVFVVALVTGWVLLRLCVRPAFSLVVAEMLLVLLVAIGAVENKLTCVGYCMQPFDMMSIFLVYQIVLLLPITGTILFSYFLLK